MQWYTGQIPEAVKNAQLKKAVFFVAILGTEDVPSQELERNLNTDEIQAIVSTDNFVCIRLEANTEQHKLFADIYANAKSPSIYCITDRGVPVDIITTALSVSELKERLESALSRHRQVLGLKPVGVSPISSSSTTTASQPTATQSRNEPSTSTTPTNNTTEASSNNSGPDNSSSSSTNAGELSLEERIQRARDLAAARQLKKEQEEAEEERRREIERRNQLKGAAELKRWQDEQAAKKLLEERKKDREEEKALRQRLREQIAQDRAARNARTNVEMAEQTTAAPRPTVTATPPANYSGQARLQFRLPDGSSQTHAFDPDSTLGHVRQYLKDQGSIPFREFSIWVAFPRRQFTDSDHGTSLRELGLLPSAALLILPLNGLTQNPAGNSSLWALIATLLGFVVYPITLVFSVFQRALPSSSSTPSTGGGGGGGNNKSQNGSKEPEDKRVGSSAQKQQQSGNVHRLRTTESGESEDEAFYNGNSTQQM